MRIDKERFKNDFKAKLMQLYRTDVQGSSDTERYIALGTLIKEYMALDWYETENRNAREKRKNVYYFSMEFLIGRLLDSIILNLGIKDTVSEGLAELGIDLPCLEDIEPDAGLGNGGLGRLAACFIDSMASLGISGMGIGIRYKYGLFRQEIVHGNQIETPDNWLKIQNVWESRRDDKACIIKFGGECNLRWDEKGAMYAEHTGYEPILAVPYDMPVPGYENGVVNTLRLWSAETDGSAFDFSTFSRGDYERAQEAQYAVSSITSVLYPDDSTERGKLLRLKQEYFFTSAGIQTIVRDMKKNGVEMDHLDEYVAIHVNDTHPALAVAELMRILVDEEGLEWDKAFKVTVNTIAYTNHTILAEALEKWRVPMFRTLLPRIYMIVEEINRRFCSEVSRRYNGDWAKLSSMSIIQDDMVKMAHLAIVGSHSVNGVAALHTEILKNQELKDFHEFYPGKFNNKTNGITHRRWLMQSNPKLSGLIDETIGDGWKKDPLLLRNLKPYCDDKAFVGKIQEIKHSNKERLASFILDNYGIAADPDSIFDIQVKRLHMYKRQILNVLHIIDLYNRICDDPNLDVTPHTYIFGAKAFPGYTIAKQTIKLINSVAETVNHEKRCEGKLKVVFMPNYGVSLAQIMIPAGDISEQISTASKEASGTGNMKFMMNGAVTVATMDGANVEIHGEVGDDNIIIFGLSSEEVINYQKYGGYSAMDTIAADPRLRRIMGQIDNGFGAAPGEFDLIKRHLTVDNDPYFTLLDFAPYAEAQAKADKLYRDAARWGRMGAYNIACSGVFSSDNTIRRYAQEIWNAETRF
ncbi:MAG: glycogen/starch/alpha-glucan phosphorylase [Clostridia bacterium]|nr:glycogen/starch/alpha-glucan phosphorylase [Clostridia bacterium]